MKGLILYTMAIVALAVLVPLAGWLGRRYARKAKGGVALASILLGIGEPLDPPGKPMIEAKEDARKRRDGKAEPKALPEGD